MAVERTFIIVKPSGFERNLTGEVLRRFEQRGLRLRGLKVLKVSTKLAKEHYDEHKDRPFFGELIEGLTRSPVTAAVLEGESAIAVARATIGATDPIASAPGTIRGDFAIELAENIVHGSDSPKSAKREIALWFDKAELTKA
ncbi:MAG: nucleoside diphosphate kinase [Thermoleophilia bacterium]|nr:nucleoside diphosphate kinase [Thermoleophilia bacterium]MCZ4496881.1 nucleoside diphosphate kinase [Thermoleophilia bacterium]